MVLTLWSFTVTTMWFAMTASLQNQIKCSYEAKGYWPSWIQTHVLHGKVHLVSWHPHNACKVLIVVLTTQVWQLIQPSHNGLSCTKKLQLFHANSNMANNSILPTDRLAQVEFSPTTNITMDRCRSSRDNCPHYWKHLHTFQYPW